MKKLEKNITVEEINAIIAEENKKADNVENYEPAHNLVILTGRELMNLEEYEKLDKFRLKHHKEINELESKIHDLYAENGYEYLENFEDGKYCDICLKSFIEDGFSFEQVLEKAEEVMDEFGHEVYTLSAIYEEIDNIR